MKRKTDVFSHYADVFSLSSFNKAMNLMNLYKVPFAEYANNFAAQRLVAPQNTRIFLIVARAFLRAPLCKPIILADPENMLRPTFGWT